METGAAFSELSAHPMLFRTSILVCSVALVCGVAVRGQAEDAKVVRKTLTKRSYVTRRLVGPPPRIDGHIDDPCWNQGEWAGDYVQREPIEGATATQPTELKILYDDRYLYVAIRAWDIEMPHLPRLMGQRDEFAGDMVGVTFDSFFNHRTAFEFDVTSAGSKLDLILKNDASIDLSWNAVWDVKVSSDARGWYAEFRIPLNQLRYSRERQQVWGLHAWRWIHRKQEESDWQLIPMDHNGFVYSMGELHGISDLPAARHIELMPYSVAKYRTREREAGNPYRSGPQKDLDGGLDAKVGLTSDFTLDLTVNPDFGQVEADPSQVNLTAFETFFPERRPFFLEGKSIFEFSLDDDLTFYSRRIGHAPSLAPVSAGFVETPDVTRILGAAKLTGRTPTGFSLGVLSSVTEETESRVTTSDGTERVTLAEPQTQLLVARAQNEFHQGNTIVGGIVTVTDRQGSAAELRTLPESSLTGGIDLLHQWKDRAYFIDAKGLFTRVSGSSEAIEALMRDPVHNYQRLDADYLGVDSHARSLTGNAGRIRAGRSNGTWRYYGGVSWRSPGVEFNDLGYLMSADWIEESAQVQYYDATASRLLRRRDIRMKVVSTSDYSGETLGHSVKLESEFAGVRNWYTWSRLQVDTARLDTRMLRGGPALRLPTLVAMNIYGETDGGRPAQWKIDGDVYSTPEDHSYSYRLAPGIAWRPTNRLRFDFKVGYQQNHQQAQYAGETTANGSPRFLIGRMDQQTLSTEIRAQVNFTPALTLTYFGGPFASVGRFDQFRVVTRPRAHRWDDRFAALAVAKDSQGYVTSIDGSTTTFSNPDFSWRELKSNLVLRWEFRPGSTLYAVWSQYRGDARDLGDFSGAGEYRNLLQRHPDNTFLVKASYWFSL